MKYTVTQVNNYIKNMFASETGLNNIYVKGEISNCKYHTSGHIYFTLKDEGGQIACVMFAGSRRGLTFRMTEGQSVIVFGSISIYERDGKYQMYAREILLDGNGALHQRYEELKRLLELQGLFLAEHKKPIPQFATKIGIVTAKTGAALQDIIQVAKRRNPYVQLILYPAIVQGDEACASIVKGIDALDKMELDLLIVGRGGGSIEDLWGFNEEMVARAVYECNTPIISAVGHETDTTIIDFVSDMRAPTPSAAAEMAVFEYGSFENKLEDYQESLTTKMKLKLMILKSRLDNYKLRVVHAGPVYRMHQYRQYLVDTQDKLDKVMRQKIVQKRHQLELYIERMKGLSPLSKLQKGYALVTDDDGNVMNTVKDLTKGQEINISLSDGDVKAVVDDIKYIKRD